VTALPSSGSAQARPGSFMYIFGAIIVICVVGWYSFNAIDNLALPNQTGTARIVAKEHRDARQTYTTDIIGGQARTVPRAIPEMYILKLDVDGHEVPSVVDKSFYSAVNPQDEVQVSYQRRRLTGRLQIVNVTR
jgi:hypothetical protein